MFLHWGKKAYSKAALTSWNLKRDKNYLYVNYLVTYYLKYSVPLTQRLQIWRWKYSWTKPLNMIKLWMIAIKYTAIHKGPLKSDLPEQNHFIFISFCSILWKPNQKRIIKIESSFAYFLHCQCPNHHSGVFIPKNNSEGPICKWFSTWWFLEMTSKLLSSKEVIYRMNHRNTMFKVIEQIAQQFSSNHKSKAYQRFIYFVVFTFEVYE